MTSFVVALLWLLAATAALGGIAASAMSFQLHSSDPAGNALAQVYLVFTLAITWLAVGVVLLVVGMRPPHAAVPAGLSWPAIGIATVVLFVAAVAGQLAGLGALAVAEYRGPVRVMVHVGIAAVPLAFVLHGAWRGLGVPAPAAVATWGCAAVVAAGSSLPWAALAFAHGARGAAAAASPLHRITYPALLVQGQSAVRVVRAADDVRALAPAMLATGECLVIDAHCRTYTLGAPATAAELPDADAAFALAEDEPMDFPAVVALLLRIERLHDDPGEDAEIRRLLAMQRSVSALSFVLPR